jgi:hypothetical protein
VVTTVLLIEIISSRNITVGGVINSDFETVILLNIYCIENTIKLHIVARYLFYAMYTSAVIIILFLYCLQTSSATASMAFCSR